MIERAEGIYLYDQEGNRFIDGAAGSSVVVNIGHGVQSVVDATYAQSQKVCFAAPHLFTNEPLIRLGQIVAEYAPGSMRMNCRTWFGTTGTDAVDSAIRVARQYFLAKGQPSKYVVIARWLGFHGNNIFLTGVHGHVGRRRSYFPGLAEGRALDRDHGISPMHATAERALSLVEEDAVDTRCYSALTHAALAAPHAQRPEPSYRRTEPTYRVEQPRSNAR